MKERWKMKMGKIDFDCSSSSFTHLKIHIFNPLLLHLYIFEPKYFQNIILIRFQVLNKNETNFLT